MAIFVSFFSFFPNCILQKTWDVRQTAIRPTTTRGRQRRNRRSYREHFGFSVKVEQYLVLPGFGRLRFGSTHGVRAQGDF